MDNPFSAASFWQFSCEHYSRADVTNACLILQDQYGLNVNILLLAVWLGRQNVALSNEDFSKLIQATKFWQQETLQPLRQLRRKIGEHLKQAEEAAPKNTENLYQLLKQAELEAEKLQQQQLIRALPRRAHYSKHPTFLDNLVIYLNSRQLDATPSISKLIDRLV